VDFNLGILFSSLYNLTNEFTVKEQREIHSKDINHYLLSNFLAVIWLHPKTTNPEFCRYAANDPGTSFLGRYR
jgi:hypothetical protein